MHGEKVSPQGTWKAQAIFKKMTRDIGTAPIDRSSLLRNRLDQARMLLLRPEFYLDTTRCLLEKVHKQNK
jgi:hypothetical protein